MKSEEFLTNPLLAPSSLPFGAPAFNLIKEEHYLPAFEAAIAYAKEEVDAIASCPDVPTFANTVEALEYSGQDLSRVEGIFFNLLEADSTPGMEEIADKVSPMLTSFSIYVSMNEALFSRVRTVYEEYGAKGFEGLSKEQKRLLEDTYLSFKRGGAFLEGEDRKEFSETMEDLSLLQLSFSNNSLAATKEFSMLLTSPDEIAGLPDYVLEDAVNLARENAEVGWMFNLDRPSYSPFMKFSSRRDLREKMWRAYNTRAIGGHYDNCSNIRQIISGRMKIASLLGYGTFADFALERRMAGSTEAVEKFLSALLDPSLAAARKEVADLTAFARKNGFDDDTIMPWDFAYWSEKYQKALFDIDETLLKPYFPMEESLNAVFSLAGTLYGITFEKRDDIPGYHPDVRVYDVLDTDGGHLALFYVDPFPRKSKRGGAWMTEFMGQYSFGGKDHRPFISIVTNFSKPSPDSPSLLTHDELTTLLHEFGHSLHGMLSRCRYPSQAGTNVARDFVELPSQIMENWAFEKEFLDSFAKHYKTGEKIPSELIKGLLESRNFQAAYLQVRQLQFGILDMAWHTLREMPADVDPVEFEKNALSHCETLPRIGGTAVSPTFGHIFSGGYSAGYYSYKWAEVLEADAFSLFQERGIFDKDTASSFRKNILERGSSEDEMVSYVAFRGHEPEVDALLRKLGII